jgi:hypothetical protein
MQTFRDQSACVIFPHHMNFLSPASISELATYVRIEPLSVFTRGVLDLDIMRNNGDQVTIRFWASVLDASDNEESSH